MVIAELNVRCLQRWFMKLGRMQIHGDSQPIC